MLFRSHLDIKHDDGTLLSEEDIKKRFPGMSEAQIREELKGFGKQMRDRTWDIIFGCWNLLFFYQYQTTVRVAVHKSSKPNSGDERISVG